MIVYACIGAVGAAFMIAATTRLVSNGGRSAERSSALAAVLGAGGTLGLLAIALGL